MAVIFSLQLECSYDTLNNILKIRHVLGRRCVVSYVLWLRYVVRRFVKRPTETLVVFKCNAGE